MASEWDGAELCRQRAAIGKSNVPANSAESPKAQRRGVQLMLELLKAIHLSRKETQLDCL